MTHPTPLRPPLPPPEADPDEVRALARVLHRALKMICAYIEKRYGL